MVLKLWDDGFQICTVLVYIYLPPPPPPLMLMLSRAANQPTTPQSLFFVFNTKMGSETVSCTVVHQSVSHDLVPVLGNGKVEHSLTDSLGHTHCSTV